MNRRTVESRKNKHYHFSTHTNEQQSISAGEMQYLKQGAKYHYGSAHTVGEIEEYLSLLTREKPLYAVLIPLNLSDSLMLMILLFVTVAFLSFIKAVIGAHTSVADV